MTFEDFRKEVAQALKWQWGALRLCRREEDYLYTLLDLVEELNWLIRHYLCCRTLGQEVQAYEARQGRQCKGGAIQGRQPSQDSGSAPAVAGASSRRAG